MNLHGAASISKVCGIYEVDDTRVPSAKFKVKVLERDRGDFLAVLNVCMKGPDGSPNWMAGLGKSEAEALEDALKWFMKDLAKREHFDDEDFEWSDPLDF
jgi:hypothetical protein